MMLRMQLFEHPEDFLLVIRFNPYPIITNANQQVFVFHNTGYFNIGNTTFLQKFQGIGKEAIPKLPK